MKRKLSNTILLVLAIISLVFVGCTNNSGSTPDFSGTNAGSDLVEDSEEDGNVEDSVEDNNTEDENTESETEDGNSEDENTESETENGNSEDENTESETENETEKNPVVTEGEWWCFKNCWYTSSGYVDCFVYYVDGVAARVGTHESEQSGVSPFMQYKDSAIANWLGTCYCVSNISELPAWAR